MSTPTHNIVVGGACISPRTTYTNIKMSTDPLIQRIVCLVLVAFYFLLRVGEYTKPWFLIRNGKRLPATCTKQFVVGNIGLFKSRVVIPRTSPLELILTSELAVMKISNQNNGRMGQTITQHATGTTECPVTTLVHIFHDILSDRGNYNTLLCLVWNGTK